MKYFSYLAVQHSDCYLREHIILPVNSGPWGNAQN